MVFTLKKGKTEKRQSLVDSREAFNLWDVLRSKYAATEKLMLFEKCTHDVDLAIVLKRMQASIQENINILEKQMEKYAIKSPDQNKSGVGYAGSSQMITDQFVTGETLLYQQEHIENLLKAFSTSITNDAVRGIFKKMLIKTVDQTEYLMQYMKLKGWIETPPLYQNLDPNIAETLTTVEAATLWDHLTFRYDNTRTTETYLTFVNDGDFKSTMEMGLKTLKKQINTLEKELNYFGIPLPKRSSKITLKPKNTEMIFDDHMYRTLLIGLRSVVALHARSLKEVTHNDRVRGIFKKIMQDELDYIDNFYKYGKLKGWFHTIPKYGSS